MIRSVSHQEKRRAGLTLTELAVALAIMGFVMAAIWAVVGTVWNNYRSQQVVTQVLTVAQNVRDYYLNLGAIKTGGVACTSGASITALLDDDDRRLIPTDMRLTPNLEGGAIGHALDMSGSNEAGGSFRVFCLSRSTTNDGAAFRIALYRLKKDACVRLLMQFPVLSPELGVLRVGTVTNGSTVNLLNPALPGTDLPMTLGTAVTWCGSDLNNEVDLDFKVRN